jgi:hypothetical protein
LELGGSNNRYWIGKRIFSCQSIVLVTIRLLGMAMCIARIVGRNSNWIFVPFFTFISEIVRSLTQPYRVDLNIGYSILLDLIMHPVCVQVFPLETTNHSKRLARDHHLPDPFKILGSILSISMGLPILYLCPSPRSRIHTYSFHPRPFHNPPSSKCKFVNNNHGINPYQRYCFPPSAQSSLSPTLISEPASTSPFPPSFSNRKGITYSSSKS